jgi:hypothetical protein
MDIVILPFSLMVVGVNEHEKYFELSLECGDMQVLFITVCMKIFSRGMKLKTTRNYFEKDLRLQNQIILSLSPGFLIMTVDKLLNLFEH